MRIVVLVKQVPDSGSDRNLRSDDNTVDRATGTILYTRRVKSGADPRDRGDVARLLDEALADLPR